MVSILCSSFQEPLCCAFIPSAEEGQSIEGVEHEDDVFNTIASAMNDAYSQGIYYFINEEEVSGTSKEVYYAKRWNGHLPLANFKESASESRRKRRIRPRHKITLFKPETQNSLTCLESQKSENTQLGSPTTGAVALDIALTSATSCNMVQVVCICCFVLRLMFGCMYMCMHHYYE